METPSQDGEKVRGVKTIMPTSNCDSQTLGYNDEQKKKDRVFYYLPAYLTNNCFKLKKKNCLVKSFITKNRLESVGCGNISKKKGGESKQRNRKYTRRTQVSCGTPSGPDHYLLLDTRLYAASSRKKVRIRICRPLRHQLSMNGRCAHPKMQGTLMPAPNTPLGKTHF